MKIKMLISILIVSFFNYIGCGPSLFSTGYSVLSESEINEGRPDPDESIKIFLSDGSEIECVPITKPDSDLLFYVKVDTPSTSLMGRGKILNLTTGATSDFNGVISEDIIDSSRILITNSIEKYFLWTNNNDCIYFKKGYYVNIQPEDGAGYFLWKPNESLTKISLNEIKEIQIKEEKEEQVVVMIISILVGTMVLIGILSSMDFPGGD